MARKEIVKKEFKIGENPRASVVKKTLLICDNVLVSGISAIGGFSTPYKDITGNIKLGNPLPYTPMGIDSPRSFAYKMYMQYKTREGIKGPIKNNSKDIMTTLALDGQGFINYLDNYLTEIDVFKTQGFLGYTVKSDAYYNEKYPLSIIEAIKDKKPFIPGNYHTVHSKGYIADINSPYQPDKSAGVDSVGLLMGVLTMSGLDIRNIFNEKVCDNLDKYYAMGEKTEGLGEDFKPIFYAQEENSILDGNYRLTIADIEKCTVIVPDISFIQKGDILVRYLENDEMHIGIVVGLGWTNRPGWGKDAKNYWNDVYVLTVRRGFQHVTLGTWGNPNGMFGGFSDEPDKYQIRRFLKYTGESGNHNYVDIAWECVKETYESNNNEYISPFKYPTSAARAHVWYPFGDYENDKRCEQDQMVWRLKQGWFPYKKLRDPITNQYLKNKDGSYRHGPEYMGSFYLRHYLPTQYNDNLLIGPEMIGSENKIEISSQTGWRMLHKYTWGTSTFLNHLLDYHRGIDIHSEGNRNDQDIFAPESGLFFYFTKSSWEHIYLHLDNIDGITRKKIMIEGYADIASGIIGVLITHPENPEKGRVYLFCHMGEPDTALSFEITRFYNRFKQEHPDKANMYPFDDDDLNNAFNAVYVNKGDWIGIIGCRGVAGRYHIHLEVFEYFKKDIAFNSAFDDIAGWQHIDPLSLFDTTMFSIIDQTQAVIDLCNFGPWDEVKEEDVFIIDPNKNEDE